MRAHLPNNFRKHDPSATLTTYKTKPKLDKEVGGRNAFDLCTLTYLIAYPICLNRKFRTLFRHASHMTPTSNPKLLKLQLGVIGISDIEWVKRKVPVLDS